MQKFWRGNYVSNGLSSAPNIELTEMLRPQLKVKLTPSERGVYSYLLAQADPENLNRVEGEQAFEFFKRSGLSVTILKKIWDICTPNDEAFLDRERFFVALRLVALAQDGKPVTEQSIYEEVQAGLPKFQSAFYQKDQWDLENADIEKYALAFSQIARGKRYLTTEEILDALNYTQVKQGCIEKILKLSDPQGTAVFTENQFVVAMHLISRLKNFNETVPDELPVTLKNVIRKSENTFSGYPTLPSLTSTDYYTEFSQSTDKPSQDIISFDLNKNDINFEINEELNFQDAPFRTDLEESEKPLKIDFSICPAKVLKIEKLENTAYGLNKKNFSSNLIESTPKTHLENKNQKPSSGLQNKHSEQTTNLPHILLAFNEDYPN